MSCGAVEEVDYDGETVAYVCDLPRHEGSHSAQVVLENGLVMRVYWPNEVKRRRRRKTA